MTPKRTLNVPSDPSDRTRAFAQPATIRRCPDCHGPLEYNHDVYCPGPVQRIAEPPVRDEPECGCIGAFHERGCPALGDAA